MDVVPNNRSALGQEDRNLGWSSLDSTGETLTPGRAGLGVQSVLKLSTNDVSATRE